LQQYLKNNREAEKALLRALSMEPENFDYLLAVTDHYIRQGRWEHARMAAQRMIRVFPGNKTGYDLLNRIAALKRKSSGPPD